MRALMPDESPPIHAPQTADLELSPEMELLITVVDRSLAIRRWERAHLPMSDSPLGQELFMTLARHSVLRPADRAPLLKQVYLDMPFSEKGVRLHLRRLESDGWVRFRQDGGDSRVLRIDLDKKYWDLLGEYVKCWSPADVDGGRPG